jgi:hypothetical protein
VPKLEKLLEDVKPEHNFITKDGQKIRNLSQLQKSLLNMKSEVFDHHANQGRNDFSNWIRDVYKNKALADTISACRTKEEISQKVRDALIESARSRKKHDVRSIIEVAKKEVDQKIEVQKKEEGRIKKVEEKNMDIRRPEVKHEQAAKKEEAKFQPKKEEHVFIEKPPRTFTKEERPVNISNKTYMKASIVDFVFGITIGFIAILILKQLL